MNRFVHFAGQNLFGTGDGEHRNLTAELFANTLHFLGGFRASGFENAVGFDLSLGLGVLDNLLTQLFAVGHKMGSTGASIGFNRLALLRGDGQRAFALVGGGEPVCNLLLPLFDRIDQRRPDVLHGDPGTKEEHDHLLVISVKSDVESIKVLFGEQENVDWNKADIDWNAIDSQLISRRVIVTRNRINGVKLGSLRLRNLYGINITRINRAGIDLLASPDLRLQIGDRLTIVGEANSISNVSKLLGDKLRRLREPNLLAIFIGLTLGVLIGSIPIAIPGMNTPIKLGVAGGPIIVGILMGAFGPRIHLTTYTTQSANLMMRQMGITIYLAGLGLSSGEHFFETVFRTEGLLWLGLGFALAIIPVLIVGFAMSRFFGVDYAHNVGMLCGCMTNPIALDYANTTVEGDEPSVAYATVYPLSTFLRIITAQLVIMLF